MRCSFVPPYLLERLSAHDTAAVDRRFRDQRARATVPAPREGVLAPGDARYSVHTAAGREVLPGDLVRTEGEPPSGDAAVDEAADGVGAALDLFEQVYGRRSFDGRGAPVVSTVHYGRDYDNAFWDGTQLVFGDGDGQVFDRFTKPVDVLGHELTHAVTERTVGLVYEGQSGALNESVSDVFGACLKQRLRGQSAAEADWLVGEGIFLLGVQARGLRDMARPGTAYDDPRLGPDPQVGDMADYVDTTDDNGGVHLNSGIPNRAFVLAAKALGGTSWEGAGRVWWATMTGAEVGPRTDFAGFAAATVAAARGLGVDDAVVADAWRQVGVTPAAGSVMPADTAPSDARTEQVAVRRTGGVAGVARVGRLDLAAPEPRAAEARDVVDRLDLDLAPEQPQPDRFVYTFELRGRVVRLGEHQLDDHWRRLVELLLG